MSNNTQKKPQKKKKTGSIIVDVVLVAAILLLAFATYSAYTAKQGNDLPGLFGVRMASVLSNSMSPTFNKGDMIFCTTVGDTSELEVGDIITFWTVINGETAVNTHRIAAVTDGGDHVIFTTKGDNNPVTDSLSVHENSVIGQYRFHIPKLGSAFEYLQTPTGFLIVIVVPVAIFFIWQLVQFFIALFAYQSEKVKLQFAREHGLAIPDENGETEESPDAGKKSGKEKSGDAPEDDG